MIERTFSTQSLVMMVGIVISAVSLIPMALAEQDQSWRFGPKLTADLG